MSRAVGKVDLKNLALMLMLLLCLGLDWAFAQATDQTPARLTAEQIEIETQTISDTMMSPFCPGRTISACPSSQARELRVQITNWLKSGYSPDGVRKQLQTIYGEDVRGMPQETSFGMLGWWGPVFFVIGSLVAVWASLRRMRTRNRAEENKTEKGASDVNAEDPKLVERVEELVRGRLS